MPPSPVDQVYEEFQSTIEVLRRANEISLASRAEDLYRRTLVLAAASWFESLISDGIVRFASEISSGASPLVQFVKRRGIERQYHSLFDWEGKNANRFFSLFGPEFSRYMKDQLDSTPQLGNAVIAFLEIGNDRNRMVHENYATFSLNKTAEEVFALYQQATPFPVSFPEHLKSFCQREAAAGHNTSSS